jgi:hypothetical protein
MPTATASLDVKPLIVKPVSDSRTTLPETLEEETVGGLCAALDNVSALVSGLDPGKLPARNCALFVPP